MPRLPLLAARATMLCAALVLPLLATACARTPPSSCAGWTDVELEPQDIGAVSDTLATWLAQHHRHWREVCEE